MISIDKFSSTLNVNPKLVLHFEKEGLLSSIKEESDGVRYYHDNIMTRIEKIQLYKTYGFKLGEIREIIDLCFDENQCECESEEIILQLINIHTNRMLEDLQGLADENLDPLKIAIKNIQDLIYTDDHI